MTEIILLLAIFLIILAQNLIYKHYWHRELKMNLLFSTRSATEGDSIIVTEIVENGKLLPLPWIDVKFNVPGDLVFEGAQGTGKDSVRSELFSIGAYKRITRTHRASCARRGFYTVKSMSVTGQDLLMSNKYIINFDCDHSLLIYPAAVDYDPFSPAYKRIMGSIRQRRFINPDPFEFRGIREYQPSDSLRVVNHRATAKTGELMVNVFEPTTSQQVTIWLNTEPYSAHTLPQVYEMSIRLAAAFAEQLLGQGLTVGFRTGAMNTLARGQRLNIQGGAGKEHLHAILEALALIDLSQKPDSVADFLAAESVSADSVHILISPYDGENMEHAAEKLRGTGQDVIWVLPTWRGTRMRVDENDWCYFWEVN